MQKPVTTVVAVLALAAIASACGAPAARPRTGDEAPEAYVGASRLRELYVETDGFLVSPLLEAPDLATRVAVWLSVSEDSVEREVRLEVRGLREDGSTTGWLPVQETWSDPELGRLQRVGRVDLGGLVIAAELRLPVDDADALAGLVWSAIVPEPAMDSATRERDVRGVGPADLVDVEGPAVATSALIAGIEPRSAWNARAHGGCSANTTKSKITVHHSVSALQVGASRATHAAAVRGIQSYHMDGRGYCDMGYHFATTSDGTVWEGRAANHLGAHTGGNNTNNAGIVFIGCFHPTSDCNGLGATTPPQVMLDGGGAAIGSIARHYGITINSTNVIGHRDNPDQTTSCPGNNLHSLLGSLRQIAGGGGGSNPAPTTGKVQGVVWDLSITTDASLSDDLNARLPGTRIAVTGGATTTARDGDSYWSFNLAPGTYTITATRDGFAPTTREVQVAAGGEQWASMGIAPVPTAVDVTVRVTGTDTGLPITNALVTVTGADPIQTNGDGHARFSLNAGDIAVTVVAEGYQEKSLTQPIATGAAVNIDVALDPVDAAEGEGEGNDPEHESPPGGEIERVTILPPPKASGGCNGSGADPDETGPLLMLSVLVMATAMRRRRPGTFLPATPR